MPPRPSGWQRRTRRTVSQLPANRPWLRRAICPYSEQVGLNRQARGRSGDNHRLYPRSSATAARTGRFIAATRGGERPALRRATARKQTSQLAVETATVGRGRGGLQMDHDVHRGQQIPADLLTVVLAHAPAQPVCAPRHRPPAGWPLARAADGRRHSPARETPRCRRADDGPGDRPCDSRGSTGYARLPVRHRGRIAGCSIGPTSDRQALAALAAPAGENRPPMPRPHPGAETMLLLATPVVRLVCPLHVLSFLGCGSVEQWRRGWDSNPRTACTVIGVLVRPPGLVRWLAERVGFEPTDRLHGQRFFEDRPIRPLWHLSSFVAPPAYSAFSCPGMAERVGFEPTVELPLHMLSRHAPSTTRSPLPYKFDRPLDRRRRKNERNNSELSSARTPEHTVIW